MSPAKPSSAKKASPNLHTQPEVGTTAVIKYHQENLKLAHESLERDPKELREFSSLTLAIDLGKIPKAKQMIRQFKLSMDQEMKSQDPEEVYHLSLQFFPVSKNFR